MIGTALRRTGQGGWTPAVLSPYAWYDAAQESYADGDPVGTWTNRGTGAGNLTASGTARPTFKTNIINGYPVLRFDSNDAMSVASFNPATAALTIWAVFTAPSGTDRIIAELSANYNSTTAWLLYRAATNTVIFSEHETAYTTWTTTGTATTSPSAFVATLDRALTTNEIAGYLNSSATNGSLTQNNNLPNTAFPSNTLYVGARAASSVFFGGSTTADLAEFGVCASALGTTDRTSLMTYLGSKYGITIT